MAETVRLRADGELVELHGEAIDSIAIFLEHRSPSPLP